MASWIPGYREGRRISGKICTMQLFFKNRDKTKFNTGKANVEFVSGAHVANLKLSSMLKSCHLLLLLFGLWKIIQLFLGKDKFCYNTRSENQLDWP